LLYRYRRDLPEGAFAICSFWEAEYLALGGGSLAQAHTLFRRLLTYRNELGLYGEEIDPRTGAALGNFPQGFTHVGLIGAALSIAEREKGEPQPRNEVLRKGRRHELGKLVAFGTPGHTGAFNGIEPQPGNWLDPYEHPLSVGHNGDAGSSEGKTLRLRHPHREWLVVLNPVRLDF